MELKTKTIEYHFKQKKNFIMSTATIIFEMNIDGYWNFVECKYSGLSETYTEEDWDFLKEVADEIKNIKKELNK